MLPETQTNSNVVDFLEWKLIKQLERSSSAVEFEVASALLELYLTDQIDNFVFAVCIYLQRIITKIKELNIVGIERGCRCFGLITPNGFHFVQTHTAFFPQLGGFTPFAERQAGDRDVIAALLMECDGATAPPNKVRRVGTDYQN